MHRVGIGGCVRHHGDLEQENEALRRAAAYLSQSNLPGKGFTRSSNELAADGIPVAVTCRVLKLARQPYYRWRANPVTDAEITEAYRHLKLYETVRILGRCVSGVGRWALRCRRPLGEELIELKEVATRCVPRQISLDTLATRTSHTFAAFRFIEQVSDAFGELHHVGPVHIERGLSGRNLRF
jgi:hypothetical protein